ncbi:hypothetical protein [Nocardia carnea]|uniref:Uncharacterized protein n=1 Tax=Nocardia carnea TaxID=37328 RepID=A0ABW7TNE8_9NOCA|nr:hypothetical protein [Nocardia carnea]
MVRITVAHGPHLERTIRRALPTGDLRPAIRAAVLCYGKRVTNVQATVDICTELVERLASSLIMWELWA